MHTIQLRKGNGKAGFGAGSFRKPGRRFETMPVALSTFDFLCSFHGRALGEKNPIGKSRAVRRPAGASRITGIEFTTTDAVAISPGEPPGIVKLMVGCPVSVSVSAGSFAPTYLCHSR